MYLPRRVQRFLLFLLLPCLRSFQPPSNLCVPSESFYQAGRFFPTLAIAYEDIAGSPRERLLLWLITRAT